MTFRVFNATNTSYRTTGNSYGTTSGISLNELPKTWLVVSPYKSDRNTDSSMEYIGARCCEYRNLYHVLDPYGFWRAMSCTSDTVDYLYETYGEEYNRWFGKTLDYSIFRELHAERPQAEKVTDIKCPYIQVSQHSSLETISWVNVDSRIFLNRYSPPESEIRAAFENVEDRISAASFYNAPRCPDDVKIFLKIKFGL